MDTKGWTIPLGALVGSALLLVCARLALGDLSAANQAREGQRTMELLLPQSRTFTPEEYLGDDPNITALFRGEGGYVVEATVAGYVEELVLWIGVDDSGTVTGLTVRDAGETWGLGQEVVGDLPFLAQFLRTTGDAAVGQGVQAITGATVTSKGVAKAVTSACAVVTGADVSSGATEWGG